MRSNSWIHITFDRTHATFSRKMNSLETIIASHEPSELASLACCGFVEMKHPLKALSLILFIGALGNIVSAAIQDRISRNLLRRSCLVDGHVPMV
jgi:hypothetical protein